MASNKYIVHSRKNVSKFHTAANQLRRENTFSNDIYQELPKRYCSYNGNNGKYNYLIRFSYFISLFTRLKAIDLDILRQMCEDTTLSLSSILKSRFSSNMNKFVKLLKSKMIYLSSKYVYILLEENDTTTDEEESQDSLPITQQFYPTFINRNPIRFHRPSYPLCRNTISRSIPVIVNKNINNQQTPSNEENTMNEFLQFLESFKIITATDGCIVHNSKYQSKFNNAINLIRRGKKYKNSIYHELPKRCCSCNGKKGLNVIDLNVLINICDEISLDETLQPLDKSSETIKLSFEPETDSRERHRRICRFIRKKGQNLNALQDKYDICIHIINGSSNKTFKRNTKLESIAKVRNIVNLDELDVLIRRNQPLTRRYSSYTRLRNAMRIAGFRNNNFKILTILST
ncbi:unnamed protein product [Adineta steineri]|uniref:Uncharacterized protein n=1 Tax=Adineta steineri TaxID=433720 RepID=A0A818W5W2_9BILA|nr:unnamed protein product [Adineta steineri]